MRLAIIGMGIMGSKYARMIHDQLRQDIEIVAVTRISPERKELLKDIFEQGVPIYESADALFEAVRKKELLVDAVLIVTPHLSHQKLTVEAMELGLHVLCDKPSGAYSRQGRLMNEANEKHKELLFGMMFNNRTNPGYQRLRELVKSGQYGRLKRVSWVITDCFRPDSYYATGAWRGTWDKEGGGILMNQCPHQLDLLQWIVGLPVSVQAFCKEGKYHDIAVEDEVTAYMEFPGGVTGTFYATTGEGTCVNRLEISMEDALLVYEGGVLKIRELNMHEADFQKTSQELYGQPEGTWKTITFENEGPQHAGIFQNFADAVHGKAELFVPGTEGVKSLMLANAMYLSSWQKRMVKLPDNAEDELAFEKMYEAELGKKQSHNHFSPHLLIS